MFLLPVVDFPSLPAVECALPSSVNAPGNRTHSLVAPDCHFYKYSRFSQTTPVEPRYETVLPIQYHNHPRNCCGSQKKVSCFDHDAVSLCALRVTAPRRPFREGHGRDCDEP
jgi:hypothetical protein